ncbi:MAG: DUF2306 domain-containing protein [Saprospiraceae bacterium]|nr:DUF2306 domain-containing protein [Saprospiraceae bacterium]
MKKAPWVIMAILSIGIGLYPIIYFVMDRKFGLLNTKSESLLSDAFWNTGFYGHIVLGGLALLIGWLQFSESIRKNNMQLHKNIGKLYVFCVLISGVCGVYIGFYATGGIFTALGFILLGLFWLATTIMAYLAAKNRKIERHRVLMIYSYAACFAAVTLRIWLPLLTGYFGDFETAYSIVAWLCWVPNIVVAYFIVK